MKTRRAKKRRSLRKIVQSLLKEGHMKSLNTHRFRGYARCVGGITVLCTCLRGGSVEFDRGVRRNKVTGEQAEVPCPRVLKDYQTLMGGVDVQDQLRLQRYSLQLSIKYKKYYKSLFLGLIDLAVINAYIVFNARRAADGLSKLSHVKFLKQLHLELCQLQEDDWIGLRDNDESTATPSKPRSTPQYNGHSAVLNDEWRPGNNQSGRKRRTRACKVCSLLKGTDGARGGDSSIYRITPVLSEPQCSQRYDI